MKWWSAAIFIVDILLALWAVSKTQSFGSYYLCVVVVAFILGIGLSDIVWTRAVIIYLQNSSREEIVPEVPQ